MHYTLTDKDGTLIDSSKESNPLAYLHGAGNIIPGLEKALVGKTQGDTLQVKIEPAEGYGEVKTDLIKIIEKKAFAGIVSGVTEWGIYVEITETKCEGMVRIADMDDDFYEYDEQNYRVIGKRNKRMISLGDEVFVNVKATDIDRRTIDLIFTEEDDQ